MENKEWVWDNGVIKTQDIEEYKEHIKEAKRLKLAEATKQMSLNPFLKNFNLINIY